ncbi:MAG TPA: VWA domain-containing protein [Vicinamibacterales bacterium]|nr:VWA domain-containing protein [Vicinamibacterales bacterium]
MLRTYVRRYGVAADGLPIAAIVLALGSLSGPGLASGAGAQSNRSSQDAAPQDPSFRAGVSAVVLDVVIRDKRGRPVRDVKPGEVTVLEDGVAREIRSFRLVERTAASTTSDPTTTAAQTGIENVPDAVRYPTLVTIVFDHLTQNSRTLARRAALQFVAHELPADQWVAVYALEQRLRLTQTFTRDPNALRSAIERATAAPATESRDRLAQPQVDRNQSERSVDAAVAAVAAAQSTGDSTNIGAAVTKVRVAEVTARMERMVETADIQQRGQSTLFPLMALMKAQGTLAGRKALLFFSEGLPIPPSLEEAYRSAISEANRANVSVYAVDARGLDTSRSLEQSRQMLDRSGRNSQSQQAYGASSRPVTMDDVMNSETAESALRADTQNALRVLAEETSGTLIGNTNDLGPRLVDRVTSDLDSYYEIGYVPPLAADGHFRSVAVKLSRSGLTVHSRSGYFALPDTDTTPVMPSELPMLAALAAEPPPHPFDYSLAAFRFDQSARGVQHTLIVEVPLNRLTFQENRRARTYTLRFTAMAVIKDPTGRVVQRFSESYPLEGPLERVPALQRGRIRFKRQFWLPPGDYTLWTIARDQSAEQSSVKSLSLVVPEPSDGIRVSELSLIRSVDQAGDSPEVVDDPFRTGSLRVTPDLDLRISKAANAQISAYVTVYPGARSGGVPALTFEFTRDGKVIGRSGVTLPEPDEGGRIKYVASFPTEIFAAGEYGLRATATQGSASASSETRFVLIP